MSRDGAVSISVVIPTLWADGTMQESTLRMLIDHPLVGEILIIDNCPSKARLIPASDKVRHLVQDRNIYVNPAWNLGAMNAKGEILCLMNDDLDVYPTVFAYASRLLRADSAGGQVGLIGLDWESCEGPLRCREVAVRSQHGYGCLMFIRRKDYIPVPSRLKIWYGDDWLFMRAKARKMACLTVAGWSARRQLGGTSVKKLMGSQASLLRADSWWYLLYALPYQPLASLKFTCARMIRAFRRHCQL